MLEDLAAMVKYKSGHFCLTMVSQVLKLNWHLKVRKLKELPNGHRTGKKTHLVKP